MSEPKDTTSRKNNTPSSPAYTPPPPPIPGSLTNPPPLSPRALRVNNDAFIKRYQTEVSASASSCLSTFIAVGLNWEDDICDVWTDVVYRQFPLDSVKTRMQAYEAPVL